MSWWRADQAEHPDDYPGRLSGRRDRIGRPVRRDPRRSGRIGRPPAPSGPPSPQADRDLPESSQMTESQGELYDIGYQHYEGPREGRMRARKAVWMNGLRTNSRPGPPLPLQTVPLGVLLRSGALRGRNPHNPLCWRRSRGGPRRRGLLPGHLILSHPLLRGGRARVALPRPARRRY